MSILSLTCPFCGSEYANNDGNVSLTTRDRDGKSTLKCPRCAKEFPGYLEGNIETGRMVTNAEHDAAMGSKENLSTKVILLMIVATLGAPIAGFLLGSLPGLAVGVLVGVIILCAIDWHNAEHSWEYFLGRILMAGFICFPIVGYYLGGGTGILYGVLLGIGVLALLGGVVAVMQPKVEVPSHSRKQSPVKQEMRRQEERAASTAAVERQKSTISSSINKLIELCTRNDIFLDTMKEMLAEAKQGIKNGGHESSRALAELILELINCRNGKIGWALDAAQDAISTPELLTAVQSVMSAEPLKLGSPGRFAPEILGDGKIGWTDSTYKRIKEKAISIFEILSKNT